MVFESCRLTDIHADRRIDRLTNTYRPRRFAGEQICAVWPLSGHAGRLRQLAFRVKNVHG